MRKVHAIWMLAFAAAAQAGVPVVKSMTEVLHEIGQDSPAQVEQSSQSGGGDFKQISEPGKKTRKELLAEKQAAAAAAAQETYAQPKAPTGKASTPTSMTPKMNQKRPNTKTKSGSNSSTQSKYSNMFK